MFRPRATPWIHRKSRFLIAGIATFGAIVTGYLAVTKLIGGEAACPVAGCDKVLNSSYAEIFGVPLPVFGFLAYAFMGTMAIAPWLFNPESQKQLRKQVEELSWLFLFIGSFAMTIFSSYLIYVMAFKIQSFCLYCIVSAICCLSLLILTLMGRDWEDRGQLVFTGVIVGMVTLIGTLAIYAPIENVSANASNSAQVALAEHLSQADAKMYGAYWCGHCKTQKELFGAEAVKKMPYIECDAGGQNPQPQRCEAAKITSYPTWEINGQLYPGVQTLETLAQLSDYQGSLEFATP
ncbi:MAG: vitamin K epoxide reductase family protein [Oscillatoriales cyanobacterium RM1_1_9]|nr:vitamin K epoxide reductase family protein [Oscillatoriales cyanobacterium SM2_3_0]NJO45987.1 vitamin K epoxide reductase family protein [Oscillatoriales cyanobacterium RM2_1_1]NJO70561.1 vitamin K epoxide reductase family protein [Oscillatoriales cyanobacterium RM1_1_9]